MTKNFTISDEEVPGLEKAFSKGLCDNCLGRLLAKRGSGLRNDERGGMVRASLPGQPEAIPPKDCWLCEGLVDEFDKLAELAVGSMRTHEYNTFLIGSKVDEDIKRRGKDLSELVGLEASEEMRSEVNREVGRRVCDLTGKEPEFKTPDIVAIIDTRFDRVKLEVRSVFIYGRYRKHKRGIPQTKWPCKACRGNGCERCNGTGKMYETSVEEMVAGPVVEVLEASGQSFHGMGREDIDARMQGNGRPFVLEIKEPKKREISSDLLSILEKRINEEAKGDVEVLGLRASDKEEVKAIKDLRCFKTYEVELEIEGKFEREDLNKALDRLRGVTIKQRTPIRVSHRRGDLVRERLVRMIGIKTLDGNKAVLIMTGEAGIYIKELITGDEGRTDPSLTGLLGLNCRVLALDVNRIHDGEMEE